MQTKRRRRSTLAPAVRYPGSHNIKLYSRTHTVKVFDLLYLNGMSLLQKSVKFRKRNLRACITEVKGRFEFAIEFDGKTAKDVRDRMDEVMANRGEGLVLKHPDAQYVLNGRNQDWIKVGLFESMAKVPTDLSHLRSNRNIWQAYRFLQRPAA
jgi:ATP-dependent DNA ligase